MKAQFVSLRVAIIQVVCAATVLATLTFGARDARAVTAFPRPVELAQPDGQKIQVQLRGDEYFSWNETEAGYAIARDTDGYWKYARPSDKAAKFDVIPNARVGRVDPKTLKLTPRAMPNRAQLQKQLRAAHNQVMDSSASIQPAPKLMTEPTPDEPRVPVSGTVTIRNIVILACFNDHWDSGYGTVSSSYGRQNTTEYDNLFNQTSYTTDGAVGSVRDYYYEVSYGKLVIQTYVTPWVRLPQTEAYYGADGTSKDTYWQTMISDAISAADTAGFNFAQGDSDSDGWVDCLTVIHSGYGQEYGGAPSTYIWSKQGEMTSVVTADGVKMKRVHTEPALRSTAGTGITRIGVVCHEMGHFFGLPDLYDYSASTLGIGSWGIMASGSWNGSDGKSPAHFCAWSKYMLGFIKPTIIHSGSAISLPKAETNAVAHIVSDGMSNEYFMVENRAKTGFDNASEIYPGMLIEHIYPASANNDLGTWAHPVVKIEEADGDDSLGSYVSYSEAGDVWTSTNGLAGGFRDQTGNQSTNAMIYQAAADYNRTNDPAYYTYNQLSGFSAAGDTMTYNASTLKPVVASQTVTSPNYTVGWSASTNASLYEIQEGSPITQTSFSDGAESASDMDAKWYLSGTVLRDSGGAHAGSYSYAMHRYYSGKWYSSVQSMSMRTPFKVTASTVVSFYMLCHLDTNNGYLKCQISNDNGNTWHTLGTYSGYTDPWAYRSFNYSAINAAGISLNDMCVLRFVANFEYTSGWGTFPGYGYAIDDVSITNTEYSDYGNWTTLSSSVGTNSYAVTGRSNGVHAYQVRAYANSAWQGFGSVGTATVNANFTLTYNVSGNGSISGTNPQSVTYGGSGTQVTAVPGSGAYFYRWSDGLLTASRTDTNVTSNLSFTATFLDFSSPVYVNFAFGGTELGTLANPFNTLAEGIYGVTSGGTLRVNTGNSTAPVRITKPMRIESTGGTVTIGR
ncbi:M6 family metalloprotease domain-containing protein [bacterium]|nr:M6 family metalloprotease domain-containing protein [bacterium]